MWRGNHTGNMTPVWAPSPGPGKVKLVSIDLDLEHKMESNHVGLAEGDRAFFVRAASWEDGALRASQSLTI